jgi:hypothetical protein
VPVSFADAAFEAQKQTERIEGVLCGALWKFHERSGAWLKRLDAYDNSVEFWVLPGSELDEIDRDVLWTLGFTQCWLCGSKDTWNNVEEHTGWERYYHRNGATSEKSCAP